MNFGKTISHISCYLNTVDPPHKKKKIKQIKKIQMIYHKNDEKTLEHCGQKQYIVKT